MSKHLLSGWGLSVLLEGDRLRAVRMELGSPAPKLGEARVIELPAGAVEDGVIRDAAAVKNALAGVLLEPEFKKLRKVVFSVCSTQVVTEVVSVPPMGEKKLAKLLAANTDVYFPVDVSDCHLTWTVVGHTADENGNDALSVRLWAAPNALLRRYYAVANECGLSVAAVDYAGNSMVSAVGARFAAAEEKKAARRVGRKKDKAELETSGESASGGVVVAADEPDELYLLLEPEHLMMTFVHAGEVWMQRLLLRGADGDELSEARFAMEYYTSQPQNADRVRLTACGIDALDEAYVRMAGDMLDAEITVLESGVGCEWCLCAGAGMTELDFGDVTFDRKPRRGAAQQAWQYGVLLAGALVLVGVLVVNFGSRLVWDSTLTGLENNRRALELQSAQNAGNAKRYYEYSDLYDNYSGDWDTLFASLRTYNDNLVLMLDELESILPKQTSVVTIGIANEGMGLQFACSSKEEAAYLIIALRQLEYADLIQISDLSIGPSQVTGPSMLPSLAAKLEAEAQARQELLEQLAAQSTTPEAAPEKGSIDFEELMKLYQTASSATGSSDPEELAKYLKEQGLIDEDKLLQEVMNLPEEERNALFEAYGKAPEVKRSLDKLISRASLKERKNALREMLTNNPIAMAEFFLLFIDDMGADPGKEILFDDISDDLWEKNIFAIFAAGESDAMKESLPVLLDIITKDEKTVSETERLIKTDDNLAGWYAYYLSVEIGDTKKDESAGKIDVDKIVNDILTGTDKDTPNKDTVDKALDSIKENLLPTKPTTDDKNTGSTSGSLTDNDALLGMLFGQYFGGNQSGIGSDALNQLINSGSLLSSGGTAQQPTDDRIYFAVALGYKQTLIDAELERKGLSATEKLEKVEVNK